MDGLINEIIKRNSYLDNIYVRRHLRDLIGFQNTLRKVFPFLPEGIWEYANFSSRIDLWCIDRDTKPAHYRIKQ